MIQRRSYLKRYAPPRRKRKDPRRSGRVRDEAWLAEVRKLACAACFNPGPCEPDHVGRRGLGQKCSDRETIPLCARCHRDRHDCRGFFAGRERDWWAWWLGKALKETGVAVTAQLAGVGGVLAW